MAMQGMTAEERAFRKRRRLADDDPGPVLLPSPLFEADHARKLEAQGNGITSFGSETFSGQAGDDSLGGGSANDSLAKCRSEPAGTDRGAIPKAAKAPLDEKWPLVDGKYRLNPNYDPPFDISVGQAIAIPPLIGSGAALLPEAGSAGFLFGRARLRNGEPSLFNSGNFRIGWSWNKDGWLGARNYFGPHWGEPGTDGHQHRAYIPGPKRGGR